MLIITKDTISPAFEKLRVLPSHLAHWQRQKSALSSFGHAWLKKPVKSHLSEAQRRAQLRREFEETERHHREHLARAKAEAARFLQG